VTKLQILWLQGANVFWTIVLFLFLLALILPLLLPLAAMTIVGTPMPVAVVDDDLSIFGAFYDPDGYGGLIVSDIWLTDLSNYLHAQIRHDHRQPFQEIFTFPSQGNQVGVTIAPRQHAPASGLPLFLVASSQNAPPPPPPPPPPQQQQQQQQGVQRLFYKGQWNRLAPSTSVCGGCWKDKRRHTAENRGENCPDKCPGCQYAVRLHT
jgi:hypothetical protein